MRKGLGLPKGFNLFYGVGLLLLSIFLTIILVLEMGKGVLAKGFIQIYFLLGILSMVCFSIIIFYDFYRSVKSKNLVADTFFLAENKSKQRVLSALRFIIPVVFALLVIFFQVGLKSNIIPVPMPYEVGNGLSASAVLAEHSGASNVFWMSVYPGLFEELSIFVLVSILVFVFTLVWRYLFKYRKAFLDPMVLIVNSVVACGVGALVFAKAHGLAYGSQSQLYVSAFIFEFFAQLTNMLTGVFTSWIPHMVHNAVVSAGLLVGLSVGGYVLASNFGFVPKKWIKKLVRR